jgi:hypothetical protein
MSSYVPGPEGHGPFGKNSVGECAFGTEDNSREEKVEDIPE